MLVDGWDGDGRGDFLFFFSFSLPVSPPPPHPSFFLLSWLRRGLGGNKRRVRGGVALEK